MIYSSKRISAQDFGYLLMVPGWGGRNFFFEVLQKIPSTFDFGSGFYTSQVKKMIEAEA